MFPAGIDAGHDREDISAARLPLRQPGTDQRESEDQTQIWPYGAEANASRCKSDAHNGSPRTSLAQNTHSGHRQSGHSTAEPPIRTAVPDLRACYAASFPGPLSGFVRVRSYDRPDRLIVTVLLDTAM